MSENLTFPYRKNIGLNQAFQLYTAHTSKPLASLKPSEGQKPFFVLLYGPPGCGKSYSFAHLPEIISNVDPSNAVYISLDALAESVGKFRSKTMEAYGQGELSKLVGYYTTTILGTYNNALYNKAPPKPKKGEPEHKKFPSLVDLRIEALDVSIREGYNIIYERTVSSTKEDILNAEIFDKIRGRYDTYVIFPQVDSVEQLQKRLETRVNTMAKTKGFARYVPPEKAEDFLQTHEKYLINYFLPKLEIGDIQSIFYIYPSSGEYQRMTKEGRENSVPLGTPMPACKGGRRKDRNTKKLKRKNSGKTRSRR